MSDRSLVPLGSDAPAYPEVSTGNPITLSGFFLMSGAIRAQVAPQDVMITMVAPYEPAAT